MAWLVAMQVYKSSLSRRASQSQRPSQEGWNWRSSSMGLTFPTKHRHNGRVYLPWYGHTSSKVIVAHVETFNEWTFLTSRFHCFPTTSPKSADTFCRTAILSSVYWTNLSFTEQICCSSSTISEHSDKAEHVQATRMHHDVRSVHYTPVHIPSSQRQVSNTMMQMASHFLGRVRRRHLHTKLHHLATYRLLETCASHCLTIFAELTTLILQKCATWYNILTEIVHCSWARCTRPSWGEMEKACTSCLEVFQRSVTHCCA